MSLTVDVYHWDDAGDMVLVPGPAGSHVAGHEVTRQNLWGAPFVVELGAEVLPDLATEDLYVETDEHLDALARDCALILDNAGDVSAATEWPEDYIRLRAGNIRDAITRARAASPDHSVVIW